MHHSGLVQQSRNALLGQLDYRLHQVKNLNTSRYTLLSLFLTIGRMGNLPPGGIPVSELYGLRLLT